VVDQVVAGVADRDRVRAHEGHHGTGPVAGAVDAPQHRGTHSRPGDVAGRGQQGAQQQRVIDRADVAGRQQGLKPVAHRLKGCEPHPRGDPDDHPGAWILRPDEEIDDEGDDELGALFDDPDQHHGQGPEIAQRVVLERAGRDRPDHATDDGRSGHQPRDDRDGATAGLGEDQDADRADQ
jgi:hypothetical protein